MIPAQDTSSSHETMLRYAGWRAVFACFLMALFLFGFALYGQGIYLVELQRLNGWPPALISGASTLSFLISNILATFTSEFVERLGAKGLVLLGIAALAASMAMLAFATTVWQLYAAFILMSLGWIGMGTVVIATVVSRGSCTVAGSPSVWRTPVQVSAGSSYAVARVACRPFGFQPRC